MDFNNLEQRLGKLRDHPNFELSSEQQATMMQGIKAKSTRQSKQTVLHRVVLSGAAVGVLIGAMLAVGLASHSWVTKIPSNPAPAVDPPKVDTSPVDHTPKDIHPSELPEPVKQAINQVTHRYNGAGYQIRRAVETQTDTDPHQTMYLIELTGSFTRSSEPNKNVSRLHFAVMADGSKIWAISAYGKGGNIMWEQSEMAAEPEKPVQSGTNLRYTDMLFTLPQGMQLSDPSTPEGLKPALIGEHSIAVHTVDGCALIAADNDGSNLWMLGSRPRPILDTNGKKGFYETLYQDPSNRGEVKIAPVWAANPHALDEGRKIVFESNRQNYKSGHSVYMANSDGSAAKLLLDAKQYGYLQIIGSTGSKVFAQVINKNTIVAMDIISGKVSQYPLQGFARDISTDGNYIKFEKTVNDYVQPGDWYLDLSTGKEIKTIPAGTEWGERPACAPIQ